jgi:hypothetical protein
MPRPEPPPIAKPDGIDLIIMPHPKSKSMVKRLAHWKARPWIEAPELCLHRKKCWQRNIKRWQHFILLITKSTGRIVKKQLDKYRIALKSYRSDLAQLAKREKFLQRAHEPEN